MSWADSTQIDTLTNEEKVRRQMADMSRNPSTSAGLRESQRRDIRLRVSACRHYKHCNTLRHSGPEDRPRRLHAPRAKEGKGSRWKCDIRQSTYCTACACHVDSEQNSSRTQ